MHQHKMINLCTQTEKHYASFPLPFNLFSYILFLISIQYIFYFFLIIKMKTRLANLQFNFVG